MTYAVKEIFLTLQGEGYHTGRAAVFLRFTGCNLWSGREADRAKGAGGCSRWCDTDFVGTDGEGGGRFPTADALADAVAARWTMCEGRPFVVCTGGEPLLRSSTRCTPAASKWPSRPTGRSRRRRAWTGCA
jgi:organic radical activating enzyme